MTNVAFKMKLFTNIFVQYLEHVYGFKESEFKFPKFLQMLLQQDEHEDQYFVVTRQNVYLVHVGAHCQILANCQ